jgi:hypothetical protein
MQAAGVIADGRGRPRADLLRIAWATFLSIHLRAVLLSSKDVRSASQTGYFVLPGEELSMVDKPVVVVTGASAGLGRAIAHAYAKKGARLGLIARNPEALDAARQECEQFGGQAITLPLDVADADAVEAAAERVEHELGPKRCSPRITGA